MDTRQIALPLTFITLLSLAGCQVMAPQSEQSSTAAAEPEPGSAGGHEDHTTTQLMPLADYTPPPPKTLAPVPDYPEDHIVEDIAALFPEDYNSPNPFAWPEKLTRYERDIWHDLRSGFVLNLDIDDPRLDAQLRWYSRNQGYFDRVAQRARRYLPHVYEQLVEHDMPLELALLPIVESAYDPFAYSHGRASGMWQFIPGTGRHYGLDQDWWYDGRRDIVASTQAAIDFLSDLSRQFDGDWELSLAAYNAGGGNVRRALRHNTNQGLPTDYWSLGTLPRETRNYVPKLIALAKIVADPDAYGIELPSLPNEPYFEIVEVGSQIDLAQAARLADITLEELYLLNPGYNQWATHPEGPQDLLIPVEHAERFRTELASLPAEERVGWARYRIQPGDSLITIANSHQTTVDVLRDVNDLRSNIIRAGDHLLIPTATAEAGAYSMSADNRLSRTQNRAPSSDRHRVEHTVRPGDSFWDISREYGVNVRQLAGWNGKAPTDPIIVGETLVVWTTSEQASSSRPSARSEIRRVGYTVRNGDNLSSIANRFNVTVADIRRWNSDLNGPYIHPGQQIELYVDVTNGPFN